MLDNAKEQDYEAKAYKWYVEQVIDVPTKLDSAYHAFSGNGIPK